MVNNKIIEKSLKPNRRCLNNSQGKEKFSRYAQKLYDKLYEFARKKGYKRIILGTYERLGRAIGFYLKNGFTECPHETYTYDDVYYSVDIESPIQKKYVPTTHLNKYSLVKAAV